MGSLHSGRIPWTCALQPSEGSPIGLGWLQLDPLSRSGHTADTGIGPIHHGRHDLSRLLRFEQIDCRLPVPERDCVGIQTDEPIDREREVRNGFLRPVTEFHEVVGPTEWDSVQYEHCPDGLLHRLLRVKN
ncbi:MAG: hypothetical protein ABFC38_03915 [Methanospirillum sp.]